MPQPLRDADMAMREEGASWCRPQALATLPWAATEAARAFFP